MTSPGMPVAFVRSLWLHSTSWNDWVELLRQSGYEPVAPPWPGEPATAAEARSHPAPMEGCR